MESNEFLLGQENFLSGLPLKIPFEQGSVQFNEYERGWVQALRGNLKTSARSDDCFIPSRNGYIRLPK
ncbi:hypothetical protein [Iodobacter fluviatilis]|uniref:Uncharacterized protein n=1 Tax=Iodobacter fluviatilis TaxID=537 RepID=A0A377Q5F4_9NEIS|nr:hypothetical protein [Iodobacter fluviatilis]TCU84587.1 hypothetical protein EV682_109112 [Iodobacter fluviatilis]STQ90052.1 Uncharacterised protein [Iodobacter fluviatilis]